MPRALKVCSTDGCPNATANSRCDECRAAADKARGSATERGYTSARHRRFRLAVLRRDPICVMCHRADSNHADHWPLSRKQQQDSGLDVYDPANARGLCQPCHSKSTAQHQPGGWNQR